MRQLILKVPEGNQAKVRAAIESHQGKNTIELSSKEGDVFMLFLPNKHVNAFIDELSEIEEKEINLIPSGIITLYPPEKEAPDQVADVQAKSELEIYLGGIQSVGSLFGLFGYSIAAGIIVWIGLYTTTIYLLVAAMLIAPFAGPAMNAALATAAGKPGLLKSSLLRYLLAIGTGIGVSFLLTLIFPLTTLTPLMVEVSHVSKVAVLLPLISGFAGALNICQSERDSLVSGAAVGILVAASLAPPVGLIGMGLYLQDWDVVFSSLFRILLQLFGIHLAATLVFYFYGKVNPKGIRFLEGSKKLLWLTSLLVVLGIGGMMAWQFNRPPFLRKASMNTELTEALEKELNKLSYIKVLNKNVSFTDTKMNGQSIVKIEASVLPQNTTLSQEELKTAIIAHLKQQMGFQDKNIYKVYQINVATD